LSSAKPSDGPFVVGAFDSDLIGVMGLIRVSEDAIRLWGVYVQPGSRAKGIGRILLQQSLQLARGLPGLKKVILSVARTEEPAIRLYTGQGFRTSNEDQGSLDMVLELDQDSGPGTE
jgi:ribosomal protein S18 acetylase RimI-like enzyme